MAKRISKPERAVVYTIIICVDILQIVLNVAMGAGVVVNRFIDIVVGILLLVYGFMRKLLTPRITLGIIGSFIVEEIPIVDVLPMWTLDVKWMYSTDNGMTDEQGLEEVKDEMRRKGYNEKDLPRYETRQRINGPVNKNGTRLPPPRQPSLPPKAPPRIRPKI